MSAATVAQVLSKAADLIEPEGKWAQGMYGSPKAGCMCAVGAIHQALGNDTIKTTRDWVRNKAARSLGIVDTGQLEDWNDVDGRTQSEVVARLREAAALAASEIATLAPQGDVQ